MSLTTLLHDLALLYLALALGADGQLDHEEQAAMRTQLRAWAPGTDPALCDHALREAALSYGNGVGADRLAELLERLRAELDEAGRARVLADLSKLAAADAEVQATESAFIELVEQVWTA